jgi:hypothetical protein
MANRYGEAALIASQKCSSGTIHPVASWEAAMNQLYPTSPVARKKSAPRGAFLGLCEEGLVKGIPPGHYTAPRDHKDYAVRAARLLLEGSRKWSRSELWQAVTDDPEKTENHQMDIVLALWKHDLIARP